ncbi:helix-turn-helix domain-containing protein [Aliarcobacter cryaerophilus]
MKECNISENDIENIYKKIGHNVKKIRTSKNISQLALSLAIGHKSVGTIAVSEIYHKNKHFNIEPLVKMADILEVDICDFFKDIK